MFRLSGVRRGSTRFASLRARAAAMAAFASDMLDFQKNQSLSLAQTTVEAAEEAREGEIDRAPRDERRVLEGVARYPVVDDRLRHAERQEVEHLRKDDEDQDDDLLGPAPRDECNEDPRAGAEPSLEAKLRTGLAAGVELGDQGSFGTFKESSVPYLVEVHPRRGSGRHHNRGAHQRQGTGLDSRNAHNRGDHAAGAAVAAGGAAGATMTTMAAVLGAETQEATTVAGAAEQTSTNVQTVASADYYTTDEEVPELRFVDTFSAPIVYDRPDALRVTYTAGYLGAGSPPSSQEEYAEHVPSELKDAILVGVQMLQVSTSPQDFDLLKRMQEALVSGYRRRPRGPRGCSRPAPPLRPATTARPGAGGVG